ncbi:hypothetical protein IGI37_000702 [Enterococcus sp. AZ194]|uniref:TetR/AcrR family transcriptional regulator n=1 Tax=Enterococcus sp. AZ194 TaxID=2774629 RepID=UPI003F25ECA5
MTNTRQKIIEVAEKLFNEFGYDKVSLRTIAAEANTTIGNLTYYFKQKEELLIAILDDLHTTFPLNLVENLKGIALLENLLDAFVTAQVNESKNSFYYQNLYEITKDSDYISDKTKQFQKHLYDRVLKRMEDMQQEGLLKPSITMPEMTSFSYTFVSLSTVWLQQNAPYNNDLLPKYQITEVLCSLLGLYISEETQFDYRELCHSRGIAVE